MEKEVELYLPVKAFLQSQGYEVKSEVKSLDLMAVRGEEIIIVELKIRINLTLILQGIDRQKVTDDVYLAVEAPKKRKKGHNWNDIENLCHRLGLGLITVNFTYKKPKVEVLVEPAPYSPRKSPRKRSLLLNEFERRTGDYNVGGMTGRPIVTAYREESLRIAYHLQQNGISTLKTLRETIDSPKIGAILQRNFYNWFRRVERGVYELTPKGEKALVEYRDIFTPQATQITTKLILDLTDKE